MRLRLFAVVLVLLIGASAPAALIGDAGPPAPPSPRVSYNLCGRAAPPEGWGPTCLSVAQPGPTLTAAQGDTVDLSLLSGDGLPHTWDLDVNRDGSPGGSDPESPTFISPTIPTSYSFVLTATPGTYDYLCGIHGISMSGQFIVTAPTNPTITLTRPDGAVQNRWTGGFVQRLTWTMTDPDGLPGALRVWLNYTSATAGNGVIAGPPTLPLGATFYDWTVPMIDASDVHVVATAIDPNNEVGTDDKVIPIIDSTRPSVTDTVPGDGAVNVDLSAAWIVNFTEPMARAATEGAFTVSPNPGGLGYAWSNGDRMLTVSHVPLQPAAAYTATVGVGARDTSLPGNPLAAPYVWSFTTTNAPPAVSLASPNGGERWTGPSFHDIVWTMSDADTPGSLTVDIHYSMDSGATYPNPILTSASLSQGTQTFSWTVPATDSNTARVRVCASDGTTQTCDASAADFAIDATPPGVATTSPGAGATDVPPGADLTITFTEPMDQPVTANPAVVALEEVPSGAWIPVSFSWAGPVLTANPLGTLQTLTVYRIHVNATAEDASDPGNAMGTAFTATFTTAASADTTPPAISGLVVLPSVQVAGGSVDISVTATDDSGTVATVSSNVTQPDSTAVNLTMTQTGTRWSVSASWTQVGQHSFVVWAVDPSGNAASVAGTFEITAPDTTPPEIVHAVPTGPFRVGVAITIGATVTDAGGVATVRLNYTDVDGTAQSEVMALSAGTYSFPIPGPSRTGTITYRIYAVDDAGNTNETQAFTLEITAEPPPSDVTLPLAIGLVLVAGILLAAVALWRRRKKPGGGETPREP